MRSILLITLFSISAQAQLTFNNTDFKYLFNQYRYSQASSLPWPGTYWPFDGRGRGAGINHRIQGETLSPAQKYDQFFGTGGKASAWEEANHNCDKMDKDLQASCRAWYGHCNGWTGAAIMNAEPNYKTPITVTNPSTNVTMTFDYKDIKALLSEAWLDAYVSFEGTGTAETGGDWVFDPQSTIGRRPSTNNSGLTNYEAYWDVTPRAFFFALTNYVGALKEGIAIDRFTGSEIWNQPVIAYRFVPIQSSQNQVIERNGMKVYPVTFGVKLYWADDSVDYDYQRTSSLDWSVTESRFSSDKIPSYGFSTFDFVSDGAFDSRYLTFTLFFDAPVVTSEDGTQIISAGRILGDGVWAHADPKLRESSFALGAEAAQTHPDFLWRPDSILDQAQYRNPYIKPSHLYRYILQRPMN